VYFMALTPVLEADDMIEDIIFSIITENLGFTIIKPLGYLKTLILLLSYNL
jgi:hypothetical protein